MSTPVTGETMMPESAVGDRDAARSVSADERGNVTRRRFIVRTVAVAGGAALSGSSAAHASRLLGSAAEAEHAAPAIGALTRTQLGTLTAVLAQLLPRDDLGPGAVEAGVPAYIDRALAASYKPFLPLYQAFLPLFDKAAASMGAASFAALPTTKQVALLGDFEAGKPPGVPSGDAASVAGDFQLLLEHMREGMFADPMYGGNIDQAGWKLIGYPGIQLVPTAKEQAIGTKVQRTGRTAGSFGGKPYNGPFADA